MEQGPELKRVLRTGHIFAAAVGLVVASTTLAGDFNGFGMAGPAYSVAVVIGFLINLLVIMSFSELATMFPKAGQVYEYTKDAFSRGKAILSTGVGTTYWAMFAVVFAAEIAAGAWALTTATGVGSFAGWVLFITVTCLIVNLIGIELAAWVEVLLVVLMVGIRVGIGFLAAGGLTMAGGWDAGVIANFAPFGWAAVYSTIPIAFWAFVGLEFAVPLLEETIEPEKSLPRGMILGAFAILVMTLIMGFGVIGALDPTANTDIYIGDAPQVAIGEKLLGNVGILLVGIASFTAIMGSVNVAFSSIPRIAYAMARDGLWPRLFAWVHPKYRTPWPATFLTFVMFTVAPLVSNAVVPLINAAAFLWLLVYLWTHVLTLKFKIDRPELARPFNFPSWAVVVGALLIIWSTAGRGRSGPNCWRHCSAWSVAFARTMPAPRASALAGWLQG